MIVRQLPDGRVWAISQENHADLSAQLAGRWGGGPFPTLAPYESMVFATTFHDSSHRDIDAGVPFDVETGMPYGHRNVPADRRPPDAQAANFHWLSERDAYSGLVVSVHHAGLRKSRYDTVASRPGDQTGSGHLPFDGMERAFDAFEPWQQAQAETLGLTEPGKRQAFWTNYCMLQVFDLLSLYFCLDGYDGDALTETTLVGIPCDHRGEKAADLHILPAGDGSVRMDPYPFDGPLHVIAPARIMAPVAVASEAEGREAFYRAPRLTLEWEIRP
jgi:hypothetical protein